MSPPTDRPTASPPPEESIEASILRRSESGTVLGASTGTATPPHKDGWDGLDDFADLPWRKRPSVNWLIGPYALYTLAFGGTIVPRLNLIVSLICRRYFADRQLGGGGNHQCQTAEIQRSVSAFMLAINVVTGTLSALTTPRLGALSDRYGRRGVMVLTSCGGLAAEVLTIFAGLYPDRVHYNWIIGAAVLDGLAGSFTAGSVVSHSYASDCTPPSRRSVAFGYMHACLFLGMAAGPLLSGYFVEWTGSLLSIFYVTLACHVAFIAYIATLLPESRSPRRQLAAREKHALEQQARATAHRAHDALEARLGRLPTHKAARQLRALLLRVQRSNPLAPLAILYPKGVLQARVRRNLLLLAAIDTVLLAVAMSLGSVTLLYSEYQFHWGNFETSMFMSLVSMVRVLVLMAVYPVVNYLVRTRPAARRRRQSGVDPVEANTGADELDVWIIRSAIVSDVAGMIGYIFARSPAVFILSGIVTAFGGLGSATIQSSLTKHVPADRVGELLGAIGLLHSLSRVFAPVVFNGLYAATVASFPQAVFVLVTFCFTVILGFSCFVQPHVYLTEPEPEPLREEEDELFVEDDVIPSI